MYSDHSVILFNREEWCEIRGIHAQPPVQCASSNPDNHPHLTDAVSPSLASRPDMQNAVRRLMRPDDMLETFAELAVKDPDLMRLVLQVSVAALVNVQSVEVVEAELKRLAVKRN